MPAVSLAVFECGFHLVADYDNAEGVFMTQAVVVGVGMAMLDPAFLGFPAYVNKMPFVQCFVLMIVVGALKTSLLIAARLFWTRRTLVHPGLDHCYCMFAGIAGKSQSDE